MGFPAKERSTRHHTSAMTHDEALSIIDRASKDSYLAPEIEQLREKCCVFIGEVMHDVNQALAEKDRRTPALLRSKQSSAVSLQAAGREREKLAKQRRELAEAMVIGALLNSDNPNWDPLDPSTGNSDGGSLLLALLKTFTG
ncbi:MAG TPA: hypothetical protein VF616_00655 [Duganella sp.]|uniref:hypothetical protein n=1 Tax=Duganella sp. TaxID=1904440 RepID=UPI002ED2D87B